MPQVSVDILGLLFSSGQEPTAQHVLLLLLSSDSGLGDNLRQASLVSRTWNECVDKLIRKSSVASKLKKSLLPPLYNRLEVVFLQAEDLDMSRKAEFSFLVRKIVTSRNPLTDPALLTHWLCSVMFGVRAQRPPIENMMFMDVGRLLVKSIYLAGCKLFLETFETATTSIPALPASSPAITVLPFMYAIPLAIAPGNQAVPVNEAENDIQGVPAVPVVPFPALPGNPAATEMYAIPVVPAIPALPMIAPASEPPALSAMMAWKQLVIAATRLVEERWTKRH